MVNNDIDNSQRILTKQEFGKNVHKFMMKNRMSQSDLSRASGLGRDSISQHVRGRSLPSPKNIQKLSDALGVEIDELFPNYEAQSSTSASPTLEIKSIDYEADKVRLRVNMEVSTVKALEALKILKS